MKRTAPRRALYLKRVELRHFRNDLRADVALSPTLNVFNGRNVVLKRSHDEKALDVFNQPLIESGVRIVATRGEVAARAEAKM